jgi:ATP-dependent helicase/nuclease subunit B
MFKQILLSPVRTDAALDRLLQVEPLRKVWVLVASKRQEDQFRSRLVEHGRSPVFNVEFFDFYHLYQRVLDRAGVPWQELSDAARYGLLRSVLAQVDLQVFHTIAHTPGLVRILGDFIFELKQNRFQPDDYAAADTSPRGRDLSRIYAAYQTILQEYHLVDVEGLGWLAVRALENDRSLLEDVALLVVDGFDQFTPVQADLLARMGEQVGDTLITLSTAPGRSAQALERLKSRMPGVELVRRTDFGARPVDLCHLVTHIFRRDAEPVAAESVFLLEAPGPVAEVAAVLRRVKALLLDGTSPDDILIALRDWPRYHTAMRTTGASYGLPLALHYGQPLTENPAMIALLDLLSLHQNDFPRRQLLDVLWSPYFKWLPDDTAPVLDRISQAYIVAGGRAKWLDALRRDGEEAVAEALEMFFRQVTPPPSATLPVYVRWIESLDRGLVIDAEDDALGVRDMAAWHAFKGVLRGLLASDEVMRMVRQDAVMEWDRFYTDLTANMAATTVEMQPARFGRVLVTTAANARGLPHHHVFVLGLSEGVFPAPLADDPLYLDGERQAIGLQTRQERSADDGLFYELVGLAQVSLTLSRPTVDNGQPWLPSPFWRMVRSLFIDLEPERVDLGAVVPADQAASLEEVAIAVADHPQGGVYAWIHASAYWQHIRFGRAIELRRRNRFDHYSGVLRHEPLLAHVAAKLGPSRLWSASQFNEYGVCGFRFFAKRLLKLEAWEEPEDGMDVMQRGSLNHTILEKTYDYFRQHDIAIVPDNLELALNVLGELAETVFETAPVELGFRQSSLWEQEKATILRKLEKLVALDFSDDNPLNKVFGPGERVPVMLEMKFGEHRPVTLDLGESVGPIRLQGFIDRVDLLGGAAVIVDYKSGSTGISLDELEAGRNYQMMVYVTAAEQLIQHVRGGVFWHITNQKTSGTLLLDNPDHEAVLNTARDHLARQIAAGRSGDFAAEPSKLDSGRCVRYCEYHQLCRVRNR